MTTPILLRLRWIPRLTAIYLIDDPLIIPRGILRPLGPLTSAIMKTDHSGMIKITLTSIPAPGLSRATVLGLQAKTLPAQLPSDRLPLAQDAQVINSPLSLLVPYHLTFLLQQVPKYTMLFNHLLMGEMSMPLIPISGTQRPTAIHLRVT